MGKSSKVKRDNKLCGQRLKELCEKSGFSKYTEYASTVLNCTPEHFANMRSGGKPITEQTARIAIDYYNRNIPNENDHILLDWLLGLVDYRTMNERIQVSVARAMNNEEFAEGLIKSHGYKIEETLYPKVEIDPESGKEYQRVFIQITSPSGAVRYMKPEEYGALINNINNIVEGLLLLEFQQSTDGAKSYGGRKG